MSFTVSLSKNVFYIQTFFSATEHIPSSQSAIYINGYHDFMFIFSASESFSPWKSPRGSSLPSSIYNNWLSPSILHMLNEWWLNECREVERRGWREEERGREGQREAWEKTKWVGRTLVPPMFFPTNYKIAITWLFTASKIVCLLHPLGTQYANICRR